MSTPATTERLAEIIRSVTDLWDEPLDEVHDVPQIVNALQAAGVGFVAEAWREAAEEVGDWEFPLDPDASKDAIAARVVLLERLSRLVYRLRERADRIGGAS